MKKSCVMLHHSLTKDGNVVDTQAIRRFHTSWRIGGRIVTPEEGRAAQAAGEAVEMPWEDIGYHLLIDLVNGRYEALLGRPLDANGAHCPQGLMNRLAIGVCIIGNFDDAPPPDEQLLLAVRHVRGLCLAHDIPRDRTHIVTHNQFAPWKTCPGKLFPLEHFIELVQQ